MALPLLIPAAAAGASYVYGRWFSDTETPQGTATSTKTVALYALAGFGAYMAYKKIKAMQ